jgi:nucleoside-diphosphate-sugar epimerase
VKFTVVGGNGFIGSSIVQLLEKSGEEVWVPAKNDNQIYSENLGTVIYCAGHGDCKEDYFKVLDSNTSFLSKLLEVGLFDRLVYLSSTRVYMDQDESNEDSSLTISNTDSRRLFNLTKLVSEELLLKSQKDIVILRPSNVYGLALKSPLFLPSIVRNAINNGKVDMYVSPEYAKDYVSVTDVAEIVATVAKDSSLIREILNLASGENVRAKEIATVLIEETKCEIVWHVSSVTENFPITNINKIKDKYEFTPRKVLDDLVSMINEYKLSINS